MMTEVWKGKSFALYLKAVLSLRFFLKTFFSVVKIISLSTFCVIFVLFFWSVVVFV